MGTIMSPLIFLLMIGSAEYVPEDLLALVEPEAGLEILGITPESADFAAIISGGEGTEEGAAAGELDAVVRSAIQNLASRAERVRERAREDLIKEGPKLLPHLRKLVEEDPRRADEAKKVIEALERVKEAAKHDEVLVRQFAIRYAAKNGRKDLIPALKKSTAESENIFVRLAAESALEELDESYESKLDLKGPNGIEELAALPANTNVLLAAYVGAPIPGRSKKLTIKKFFDRITADLGEGGFGPGEENLRQAHQGVIDFVRQFGNMRPERIHLVHVGAPTETGGGVGIIVHGLYDRSVLETSIRGNTSGWTSHETAGFTVFSSIFARLVPLSDRSILVLPNIASVTFPIREYLESVAAKKEVLSKEKEWTGFFAALTDDIPIRGLVRTEPELMGLLYGELEREMPADAFGAVKGMKALSAMVAPAGEKKITVRLEGSFEKNGQAESLASFIRQGIDMAIAEMKREIDGAPPFIQNMAKRVLSILEAITVTGEGKTGVLRFTTDEEVLYDFYGILGV